MKKTVRKLCLLAFLGDMKAVPYFIICSLLFVLVACGQGNPAPVIKYGLTGGANSAGVHTVGDGDTLWSIAQRYNIDMKEIVYVNNLRPPYFLERDQRLTLPPPATYRVRQGDTLYDISRTFSVSMTRIAQQNNLSAPYRISAGDKLLMPTAPRQSHTTYDGAAGDEQEISNKAPVLIAPAAKKPAQKKVLQAVKTKTPKRASGNGKFAWPVKGKILSSYGPKKDGLHNDGVNIKSSLGAPVRAAENGVIVYADNQLQGYGNLILVRHEDKWMSAYAHLEKIMVKRGDVVKRGQSIGTVGRTGSVDTPQLHFEIRRGTKALNPLSYLD